MPPATIFYYAASVSGLRPNITYAVTIESLTSSSYIDGARAGCVYPSENAGSFATTSQ
ncbi:MAG: hypothetical protein IAI50_03880 [Candidatus Eremiobacteraeota bacterium]|nr:hypothetical protein [Candidatus Eremiobacteraeota bacterium]